MKFARNRKPRPKTFNTEEAANNWAKENDIKNYSLENVKNAESTRKKIRIVVN